MKRKSKNITRFGSSLALSLILMLTSCYKDKGNYEYNMPLEPKVVGLDTMYNAMVGDSLIINPTFENIAKEEIECIWEIAVPEAIDPSQYTYEGNALRTVFGLQAKLYNARLTLLNKTNGIKYFYDFKIQGKTEFSTGSLVLSEENGTTQLSFIKPNGEVQARIYEAINLKSLPDHPLSVHFLANKFTGNTPLGYWVICKNEGVRLDVNNLKQEELKPGSIKDNFFLAPPTIEIGSLQKHVQGVLMGVINGKFYGGITTTWDQANTYGMFGTYADGDYELHDKFILSNINDNVSMIAFDKNRKQFLRFNLYGAPMFFGTQYTVTNSAIFDPTNIGLELLDIVQINNTDTYAYCKDVSGTVYELKFNVNFNGPFTFTPLHKKSFINQQIITDKTKMIASKTGYIYFAHSNKVYSYTPINQNLVEIDAKFSNEVSMIKLSDDEQTLIVGAGTSLYYTNVSTGNNGVLKNTIQGIPGKAIDITWR
jgi:hypothetical protein